MLTIHADARRRGGSEPAGAWTIFLRGAAWQKMTTSRLAVNESKGRIAR
jgi:hypothetical protein